MYKNIHVYISCNWKLFIREILHILDFCVNLMYKLTALLIYSSVTYQFGFLRDTHRNMCSEIKYKHFSSISFSLVSNISFLNFGFFEKKHEQLECERTTWREYSVARKSIAYREKNYFLHISYCMSYLFCCQPTIPTYTFSTYTYICMYI